MLYSDQMRNKSAGKRIIRMLRAHSSYLRASYDVRRLGLFGSYARGQARKGSDLDILIEFNHAPSLLRFMRLEGELSKLTGTHVELVMKSVLKPNIGRHILKEVIPIFPVR